MKPLFTSLLLVLGVILLSGCKPSPHPSNPNYGIKKPPVRYPANRESLSKMVQQLEGKPYVWAAEGPNTFDCSGYIYYMYGSMGMEVPRVARDQARVGKRIGLDALKYGDLIFFDTDKRRRGRITHVGMYLGNGWFTHASTTKNEVVYSNLQTSRYYRKRLRICRRYLPDTQRPIASSAPVQNWQNITRVQPTLTPKTTKPPYKKPTSQGVKTNISGHFYVQVGSFKGKPSQTILNRITNAGYRYKIITFPINGSQIAKLLIGPYKQRSDALRMLSYIRENIQPDAFIAEIRYAP